MSLKISLALTLLLLLVSVNAFADDSYLTNPRNSFVDPTEKYQSRNTLSAAEMPVHQSRAERHSSWQNSRQQDSINTHTDNTQRLNYTEQRRSHREITPQTLNTDTTSATAAVNNPRANRHHYESIDHTKSTNTVSQGQSYRDMSSDRLLTGKK